MKKFAFLVLLLATFCASAQSVNNYKGVIIPTRFEVQSEANQYRLNSHAKKYLIESGFEAIYESMMTSEQANHRCDYLLMDVVKVKSMFTVKVRVVFKDCRNQVVYESAEGMAREKEFAVAYPKALQKAFESVRALQYKYEGGPVAEKEEKKEKKEEEVRSTPETMAGLMVEPTASGYLIYNGVSDKIVFKLFKTSQNDTLIAIRGNEHGVFLKKGDRKWAFEYYKDGKVTSEEFDYLLLP